MIELVFDCVNVRADRYAASPTLVFVLRIAETTGETIHAIALRCQIRLEPVKRRYSDAEGDRLSDLFGERSRWGDTMKPMQFAFAAQMVPTFRGSTEVEIPVPVTYDFEVATAKYFHGIEDGEVPLLLLFSGTVFRKGAAGFSVEQVPWHKEAVYRLPIVIWREAMDAHFPNQAWVRLRRDTFEELRRFVSRRGFADWDGAVRALLAEVEGGPGAARAPAWLPREAEA
jgi:hypothetical protein